MDSFFDVLALPKSFKLDLEVLEQRWKVASAQVHPDRFVTATPTEKRLAMQWATRVNEAYETLRDPIKRASHLCQLAGYSVNAETNTAMSSEFLMKQMQWREQFEQAQTDLSALCALEQEIEQAYAQLEQSLCQSLEDQNYTQAVASIREAMFLQKLRRELKTAKLAIK